MAELKTRILVVDDDQRLRDLLVRYLGGEGYEVKAVPDAAGMDKQLARERYDLLVLDLMLPGEDGLAICRRLRAGPAAPAIVMLTAKGDDVDRIVGLEMGADDYLPKPFNPRELLARINAVLRRKAPSGPPGAPAAGGVFAFGEFTLSLSTRTLTRDPNRRAYLLWREDGESAYALPAEWNVQEVEPLLGSPAATKGATVTLGPLPVLAKADRLPWGAQ